ncbi:hypothetical protein [Roseomonas xinghualingensis]|uniref:hypothetical protein n=1 Tax=Roseomonas xinghualingensis TaxID=2986475 RepID=UPI0021F0ED38|nr:hypothetical protein [Roseomonas sp. SXEYE001]MCV4207158.1 hypothetical protein [Roseomonas sp. SXEYE001]
MNIPPHVRREMEATATATVRAAVDILNQALQEAADLDLRISIEVTDMGLGDDDPSEAVQAPRVAVTVDRA